MPVSSVFDTYCYYVFFYEISRVQKHHSYKAMFRSWNRGVPMASRRGQILLAVFCCVYFLPHAACHCFNSGALPCACNGQRKCFGIARGTNLWMVTALRKTELDTNDFWPFNLAERALFQARKNSKKEEKKIVRQLLILRIVFGQLNCLRGEKKKKAIRRWSFFPFLCALCNF